jgi:hypothetical protein
MLVFGRIIKVVLMSENGSCTYMFDEKVIDLEDI